MKKIRITSASLSEKKTGFILKGITAEKQPVTLFIRRGAARDSGFLMPAAFVGKLIDCEVAAEQTATGMFLVESLGTINQQGYALAEQALAKEYAREAFAPIEKSNSGPAAQPAAQPDDSVEYEETVDTDEDKAS